MRCPATRCRGAGSRGSAPISDIAEVTPGEAASVSGAQTGRPGGRVRLDTCSRCWSPRARALESRPGTTDMPVAIRVGSRNGIFWAECAV